VYRDLVDSLFARYREPVYRFLRRVLRDATAAEDLTQETFLRALKADYRADGRERGWIFEIARNLARDHDRARNRRPLMVQLKDPVAGGDLTLGVELTAAFDTLDADDRDVFLLKEIAGLIDLEIDLSRGDRLERREGRRDPSRGGYGMGRKVLQLTAEQAIEIELPAPFGFHGELASPSGADAVRRSVAAVRAARPGDPLATPTQPLSIVDGGLVVSFKPYFEGHRLSVVLQAKPVG
jgi:hypothetical protein